MDNALATRRMKTAERAPHHSARVNSLEVAFAQSMRQRRLAQDEQTGLKRRYSGASKPPKDAEHPRQRATAMPATRLVRSG